MTRRVSIRDIRANLSDVIGSVFYTKEPVIVERKGRPMAVLISPEEYERYVNERFREAVEELRRRNVDKDPDEVFRDVTEIVEEVRQERYDRERREQADTSGC